jgi:hypothetical protein
MKKTESEMENRSGVLSKEPKKSNIKEMVTAIVVTAILVLAFWGTWYCAFAAGQTVSWDLIFAYEENLRDLHSNAIQTKLQVWLPNNQMNFTDGLIWESNLLEYNMNRPNYEDVIQVLNNGKGACGEFVWVFAAFCIANDIPVRVVTVGYFSPNVVDHSWAQVNPSNDGKTWIHVEVTDTCVGLKNGKTINDLWNVTINNNACYRNSHYKMVLAYELNQNEEIVITDVTATFSSY